MDLYDRNFIMIFLVSFVMFLKRIELRSSFSTCEEYVASEEGAEKCGYSERYRTYLKRNVFWPDVDDYIGEHTYMTTTTFWGFLTPHLFKTSC